MHCGQPCRRARDALPKKACPALFVAARRVHAKIIWDGTQLFQIYIAVPFHLSKPSLPQVKQQSDGSVRSFFSFLFDLRPAQARRAVVRPSASPGEFFHGEYIHHLT